MLMSLLITVSLVMGGGYSQDAEQLKYDLFRFATGTNAFKIFHEWAERYEKSYGDLITTWLRFKIFADNMKKAINLNQKYGGRAMFGPTQFADLTPEEFASTYLVTNMENMVNSTSQIENKKYSFKTEAVSDNEPPLETVDWTEEGVVTSIKDQGRVGTCYIFAALAVIESRWAQKGNEPISLSAEQVADCLAVFGGLFSDNLACGVNGGLQPAVYRYIQEEGGITADKDYPYCVGDFTCKPCPPENYSFLVCGAYPYASCRKSDSCQAKYDSSKFVPGLKVKSWSYVSKDETKMAKVLSDEGPLSSALDATDLQLYHSGILQQDKCKPDKLNHAVVLVGYGQEGDTKYWKVKNSWGDQFGEKGYFRIARGSGTCGINRMVTTVDVE